MKKTFIRKRKTERVEPYKTGNTSPNGPALDKFRAVNRAAKLESKNGKR